MLRARSRSRSESTVQHPRQDLDLMGPRTAAEASSSGSQQTETADFTPVLQRMQRDHTLLQQTHMGEVCSEETGLGRYDGTDQRAVVGTFERHAPSPLFSDGPLLQELPAGHDQSHP